MKELFDLYLTFFKIGAITFGGGYAMFPLLEKELANKRHWTSPEDLLDYYAISQVTPGVIAVNVSTFVGYKRRGIVGGIFATAGIVSPSIIVITIISLFISNFQDIIWIQKALKGINVAVTALLTYSVINFAKKSIKNWWALIFYIFSFCGIYFLRIPSVIVILLSALCGIGIAYFSGNLKKINATEDKK